MLDREAYFARWAELHGGYDPGASRLAGGWLRLVYVAARRCARLSPSGVTALGLAVALIVPALAAGYGSGRWLLLAAALAVLVSGFLDSLDGAVAVLTGRETRFGSVLDSVADRVADSGYVLALWLLGAPGWTCALGAGLAGLQEYARARAAAVGMPEIGVVTVWERPTRIALAGMLLVGSAVLPDDVGTVVTAGAAAWALLGVVGTAQLMRAARRALG